MNKVVAIALLVFAASCKNHGTHIKKGVSYNGNMMRIEFKSVVDGNKQYDYDKTFDVTGLSKEQQDSIVKHISDSLAL